MERNLKKPSPKVYFGETRILLGTKQEYYWGQNKNKPREEHKKNIGKQSKNKVEVSRINLGRIFKKKRRTCRHKYINSPD